MGSCWKTQAMHATHTWWHHILPRQQLHRNATTQPTQRQEWLKRFHVLHSEIRMTPERVCTVIGACAVLHNIIVLLNEPMDGDPLENDPDGIDPYRGPQRGLVMRDQICDTYFAWNRVVLLNAWKSTIQVIINYCPVDFVMKTTEWVFVMVTVTPTFTSWIK